MAMTLQRNLASASTTTVSNETCFVSSSHITNAFLSFQDMRTKEENCDIFICIHGQRFPAHRVVLAGTCKFFREKLVATQVDEEEKPPHFKELEIPEQFDKQIVQSVLDFLYTGKLVLNFHQMNDMLRLLCYLQIDEAILACERFSIEHLRANNCIKFVELSEDLDLGQLKQTAMEYIEWNFTQVAKENDFVHLTTDQLISLLRSNNLRVKREDRVYEAVWKWYKHAPGMRNQDLVSVMKTVRFRQMSTKFLRTRVIPELVEGEEKCRQEVEDALTARRFSREDKDFGTPRNSGNMVYIFSSKTSKFDLFDNVHNACVPCPELTCSDGIKYLNNYRCAVVVQDELYVVSKREVIRFNHVTRKWTWVGDGRSVREAGICSKRSNIYVTGGKPDDMAAHVFDVRFGQWSSLPEMIRPRRCHGVTILKSKIYVIGGINDDGLLTTMECYNIKSQKWKQMPGLLAPRFSFGVTAWAGSIFIYGGRNDRHCLKTMEIYRLDPGDKWIFAPARLHDARSEFGYAVYENQIYCFGGRGVSTIECYDYVNEHWRVVGRVGETTYSINCVVYPPLRFSDVPSLCSVSTSQEGPTRTGDNE